MALALYRKYRPRTFAEVIGQEHVTEPLAQALRSGRLHHAYLFSGPRGCGKTSSARILARSLNCAQGPTPEPCGECDSCRALAPDGSGSIDVIEIDAASHGGVDDARELRERAFFAPVSSRFKVYVIDEAHMVSSAGFNALLKLVEEPPDYVKFVFATTEPEKVLGTIKSRTHHYPFRLIPPGVLRPYLEQLTVAEGVKVDPAVFPLVVRAGAGSARDTLSVLDQLIAGAGAEGVTYGRAVALLGVTDVALIDEMCDALAAGDGRTAYGVIDRVAEAGHDARRFASDLLERLRDLIILQQVPDAVAKGLLDAPEDQLERMGAQALRLGAATLSRFADIVHTGLTEMRGTTAPRLLLELICARMLLPGAEDSHGALLQRLERMERRLAAGAVIDTPAAEVSAVRSSAPPTPISAPPPPVPGPPVASAPSQAAPSQAASGQAAPALAPPVPSGAAPTTAPAPHSMPHSVPPPAPAVLASRPQSGPVAQASHPASAPAAPASLPQVTPPGQVGQPAQAPAAPAQTPPGQLDAAAVRRVWPEVLSLVSSRSKKAAAIVREATVQDVEGETLVLVFKHGAHATMLSGSPDVLLTALTELLGGRWQVRCEVGQTPGGASRPASAPPAPRAAPPPPRPPSAPSVPSAPSTATEDWPTPARLGGEAPAADQRTQAPQESWPTPTQPGGSGGAGHRPAPAAEASGATASTRSGVAQARAAASRAATTQRKGPADSAWDGPAADEPPYDPEYDAPVGDPRYPGFDPGDEPLDDAESGAARETGEEAALRLLSEALGAEKISESGS